LLSVIRGTGPLLTNVEVETVYYGAAWITDSGLRQEIPQLNQFFQTITNSSYMYLLGQYGVGTGKYLDDDVIPAGPTNGSVVSDWELRTLLQTQMWSGGLQFPTANRLYVIFTPPNAVVTSWDGTRSDSYNGFAGYHWDFTDTSGDTFYYAVIVYPEAGRLSNLSDFQRLTKTSSHELAEAITDPQPWSGWRTPGSYASEIGDGGETNYGNLNGYTVQALWSNLANAFVFPTSLSSLVSVNPSTGALVINGDPNQVNNHIVLDAGGNVVWVTVNDDSVIYYASWVNSLIVTTGRGNDTIDLLNVPSGKPVTLSTGAGDDQINIRSVAANSPVQVNAGDGNDVITLGAGNNNLDNIAANVTVDGGSGTNKVLVNDQGNAGMQFYDVTGIGLQRWYANWTLWWSNVQNMVLNTSQGSNGRDYVDVNNTGPAPALQVVSGAGGTILDLASWSEFLDNLPAGVTFTGGNGYDQLLVEDQNDPYGDPYTVTSTTVTRPYFGGVTYTGVESVVLHPGAAGNTVSVPSTQYGTSVQVYAGNGGTTLDLGNSNQFLDNLHGPVTFSGGGGYDRLLLEDQNDPYNDTYTLTSSSLSRIVFGGVTFSNVENIVFDAGAGSNIINVYRPANGVAVVMNTGGGNDTVRMLGLDYGSGTNLSITGGGGLDTLDYSAYTLGVYVNLATSQATAITGGISGFRNVIGGAGNDILIGDANDNVLTGNGGNDILVGGAGNDTLYGGDGRNLLIGGTGSDLLYGGSGDDLLIGGTTSFDANVAALQAILTEWGRADADYNTRVNHLNGSLTGGWNGAIVLNSATVQDDGISDTLYGLAGMDWFFANANMDVTDRNQAAGERLN
jgi:hypothetical protein